MVRLSDFRVISYPDGHKHVVSDKDLHGDCTLEVSIKSFDDLFLVAQVKKIHPELSYLQINYLLAARCDRRFSPGEAIDLEIVTKFIQSLGFDKIIVVKPHSEKTRELLNTDNSSWTYEELDYSMKLLEMAQDYVKHPLVLVSPDEGARPWVSKVAYNRERKCVKCEKVRDSSSGKITKIEVPPLGNDYNYLILDDLCDGGATFIGIANSIKEQRPEAKVYLAVTHGIFSKGFKPFEGIIEHIFCTDSYQNIEHPLVTQLEI